MRCKNPEKKICRQTEIQREGRREGGREREMVIESKCPVRERERERETETETELSLIHI